MTNTSEVITEGGDEDARQQHIDAVVAAFTPAQFALVADHFCNDIRGYVGDEAFVEIAARNAARSPEGMDICHTHDFCDANVFMSGAFKKVLAEAGLQFDEAYEVMVDPAPWDRAWSIAQKLIPEILAQRSSAPRQGQD